MTALISLLPGTAAAVTPQVVLLNCYYPNGDGSVTVVLGYRSTYPSTTTIPRGSRNNSTPAAYGGQLPTTFKSGTNNGVATVRVAANNVNTSTSWYLDGTTLNYLAAAYASGTCPQAPLPAFANGAALVVVMLLAAVVGVLVCGGCAGWPSSPLFRAFRSRPPRSRPCVTSWRSGRTPTTSNWLRSHPAGAHRSR